MGVKAMLAIMAAVVEVVKESFAVNARKNFLETIAKKVSDKLL